MAYDALASAVAMRAQIRELRAALQPFADIGLVISHAGPIQVEMIDGPDLAITPAHVHRARAALGDG